MGIRGFEFICDLPGEGKEGSLSSLNAGFFAGPNDPATGAEIQAGGAVVPSHQRPSETRVRDLHEDTLNGQFAGRGRCREGRALEREQTVADFRVHRHTVGLRWGLAVRVQHDRRTRFLGDRW